MKGQASDVEIHAKEILSLRDRLNKLYVKHTGRVLEEIGTYRPVHTELIYYIEKSVDRDNFMSPEEACKFGLIDKVIEKREDMVPAPSASS